MHRFTLFALLATGCNGPVTNAMFLEDAAFVGSLPTEDRFTIHFERTVIEPLGAEVPVPALLGLTRDVSGHINGWLLDMLGLVDRVRSYPPTDREEDLRRWGPWEVSELDDNWLQVEIDRAGIGLYDWSFQLATMEEGPWQPVFVGTHVAGETVATGEGSFEYDFEAWATVLGVATAGQVEVVYDTNDGAEFTVASHGLVTGDQYEPLDARYWYRLNLDSQGDFEYATSMDIEGGGQIEAIEVRTRWNSDLAGRADARASGGDLGEGVYTLSQCWDASETLVYQADTTGLYEAVGSVEDCVQSEAAWPEHLGK